MSTAVENLLRAAGVHEANLPTAVSAVVTIPTFVADGNGMGKPTIDGKPIDQWLPGWAQSAGLHFWTRPKPQPGARPKRSDFDGSREGDIAYHQAAAKYQSDIAE